MASHPGTSRRCHECRRRRKKCDLTEPECTRCVSKGIKCSGPNNHHVYVLRDAQNMLTQTHRGALRLAMQRRAALQPPRPPSRPDRAGAVASDFSTDVLERLIQGTEMSLLKANLTLTSKPAEFFYATVLEDFRPRASGVFKGDRLISAAAEGNSSSVSLCIRGLLPLAKPAERRLLDMALFSVLTMYMSRLAKDSKLAAMACSAYTSTIREFRHTIGSRFGGELTAVQPQHRLGFLALSTALQLFEFVSDMGTTGPGFLAHYEYMVKLLQLSGPGVYQSGSLTQSFAGLRGITAFLALEKRQDVLLSRPEWKHIPFLRQPKSRKDELYDIALGIPLLLDRTDRLLSSIERTSGSPRGDSARDSDPLHQLSTAADLLACLAGINLELDQWLAEFKDYYSPIPLYWQTHEVFDRTYSVVDAHCIPNHDDPQYVLRFRDGQKAGFLICYWGITLELLTAVIDVQGAVATIMTPSPSAAMHAVTLCQNMDAHRAEADATASLMLQSLPYLECCLEGIYLSRLPMRVVHRYFARHARLFAQR